MKALEAKDLLEVLNNLPKQLRDALTLQLYGMCTMAKIVSQMPDDDTRSA